MGQVTLLCNALARNSFFFVFVSSCTNCDTNLSRASSTFFSSPRDLLCRSWSYTTSRPLSICNPTVSPFVLACHTTANHNNITSCHARPLSAVQWLDLLYLTSFLDLRCLFLVPTCSRIRLSLPRITTLPLSPPISISYPESQDDGIKAHFLWCWFFVLWCWCWWYPGSFAFFVYVSVYVSVSVSVSFFCALSVPSLVIEWVGLFVVGWWVWVYVCVRGKVGWEK